MLALVGVACLSQDPLYAAPSARPPVVRPAVPGNASLALDDSYIIGPGDVLELRLVDAPELSGVLSVLNDGTVALPLLGFVRVSGLTLQQATFWFRSLFSQQLQEPMLFFRLVSPRPVRVAVVGEVQKPGVYVIADGGSAQIPGGSTRTLSAAGQVSGSAASSALPTVVEAIQRAGGITPSSDLRKVTLQRRLPGDQLSYKQANLDLLSLVLEGNLSQNPLLFDGDTIRISSASVPVPESMELANVNLSPETIRVNVIGEVETPGAIQLMANTPLVQAVLAAGGPKNWRANVGNIDLVRINRNGTATFQKFKLDLSQGASNTANPPLRDGDTVRVNRSTLGQFSDALDAFSQPLNSVVNTWALFRLFNTTN